MTMHGPGWKVRDWISEGLLKETDPDEVLERLMDEKGYTDVSWRHEALCSLRLRRHETLTGDPF